MDIVRYVYFVYVNGFCYLYVVGCIVNYYCIVGLNIEFIKNL